MPRSLNPGAVLIVLLTPLVLAACSSGISQNDYNAVQAENQQLKQQVASQQAHVLVCPADEVNELQGAGKGVTAIKLAEGDKVVTRFEWTGTHRGEFLGVPATGRSVKVWGVVIDRLEAGRIKDTRILMDALGLMMQLGALPASAT